MIAVSTDYLSIIEALPPDAMTIFRNIAWDEYKAIVKALGNEPRFRLAYDNGTLQITNQNVPWFVCIRIGQSLWTAF
jgi:hypothetical protein